MFGGLMLALCCTCGVSQQASSRSQLDGPVIVRVVSRDSTILARAGQRGAVYSVLSKDGQIVVPAMTVQQLQARRPDVARQVRAMTAADTSMIWAGMDSD